MWLISTCLFLLVSQATVSLEYAYDMILGAGNSKGRKSTQSSPNHSLVAIPGVTMPITPTMASGQGTLRGQGLKYSPTLCIWAVDFG